MNTTTLPDQENITKLAIIGCGAITETFYLPAIAQQPSVLKHLVLVDRNIEQAKKLAHRYGIQDVKSDYREVVRSVQGAIVAVPHHLHFVIAADFLAQGVHVLCEKPLTESAVEGKQLCELAEKNNVTLSVNMTRRLMASSGAVRDLLRQNAIGKLVSLTYFDGAEFNWPTASGFYFDYRLSQRGVTMDIGAHILDLMCWWLGDRMTVVSSENDSFGGCEAVSSVQLDNLGCSVNLRMSRLAKLENRYRIIGEEGHIEGMVYKGNIVQLRKEGRTETIRCGSDREGMAFYAQRLTTNFLDVVSGRAVPLIAGREVLKSIELMEEAYAKAKRFSLPWYEPQETVYAN